ncbi:MAG: alternative oxidase [Minisyncoccia bacterium]
MDLVRGDTDLEQLNQQLNDPQMLAEYKKQYDNYKPAALPRILGKSLVWWGNVVYGKKPSYMKFRAIEVIARVPYHSWASAAYTLLTLFYRNEQKAMQLSQIAKYARLAQDNETMHVVVISHLASQHEHAGFFRHTLIPMLFAFIYFWWSYFLYLIKPRYSYELNYMFENHAFEHYSEFLEECGDVLKSRPIQSDFLEWYGRHPRSQYEFFLSVRNDELIHRNTSLKEINHD